MTSAPSVRPRGRPKKLDKDRVVAVAMQSYWSNGVSGVSLNEICRRASASKPAVYREFGDGDNLINAALNRYYAEAMKPVKRLFASDLPFEQLLDEFVTYIARDKGPNGNAAGCLFAKMCNDQLQLGPKSARRLQRIRTEMKAMYAARLERAKTDGHLATTMPVASMADYMDVQMLNMYMQKARGEAAEANRERGTIAFSVL